MAKAYFREAGSGPAVLCLHCSASTSGQWRPLMEQLAGRYRVIAPDLYGCGKSPAWPAGRPMWIDDQVALLERAFERAGERFHLIGHSYGGAIALKAALGLGPRLASLVLYEPVLFAVLLRAAPQSDAAREITAVRDDVLAGEPAAAAERFIDYWMGKGTWAATPDSRRAALVEAVQAQTPEWHSAFNEPTPLHAFAALNVPTLLMTGTASTAAARAVARLVGGVLPRVRIEEIEGLGHMAPVTDPGEINPRIERFLADI
ncbi:MAG TPA: alpha/beta hydrolase [Burkholderiales bacterium]|jgi:pimeloyl-ACP methyl ester carboxylesterase|nr:alpha/beta hydrolase [Burkholderiales bacterium]